MRGYGWRLVALRVVCVVLVCGWLASASWSHGQESGGRSADPARLDVELIPEASAATRLTLSQSGRYAAAELRGDWIDEERFGSGRDVPPVVKLVDLASLGDAGEPSRRVVASITGWAMGAPTDDGDLLWVEEYFREYQFRIRSLARPEVTVALAPPPGSWTVKAALRFPGARHAVVILCSPVAGYSWRDSDSRRERLWLAAIDIDTLAVAATLVLDVTTQWPGLDGYGAGVAVGPAHVYVAALPVDSTAWKVLAIDAATLQRRWEVALELSGAASVSSAAVLRERGRPACDPGRERRRRVARGGLWGQAPGWRGGCALGDRRYGRRSLARSRQFAGRDGNSSRNSRGAGRRRLWRFCNIGIPVAAASTRLGCAGS